MHLLKINDLNYDRHFEKYQTLLQNSILGNQSVAFRLIFNKFQYASITIANFIDFHKISTWFQTRCIYYVHPPIVSVC